MNGTIIKTNVLQLIALVSFQQSAYPQDISARNYHPPLDEYRVLSLTDAIFKREIFCFIWYFKPLLSKFDTSILDMYIPIK